MADFILVDTSVLSEARRSEPDSEVLSFLRQVPAGALAVPPSVSFELERGALNLSRKDPILADKLSRWLDGLLATDIWEPPINGDVKRLLARMAMTPELRRFWISKGKRPNLGFGCDPEIAATAIVHQLPIASLDVSDFLLIHRFFPLPGFFCPRDGVWHVLPAEDWQLKERLSIDDWRVMIGPVG